MSAFCSCNPTSQDVERGQNLCKATVEKLAIFLEGFAIALKLPALTTLIRAQPVQFYIFASKTLPVRLVRQLICVSY
jgi:hypothetical protein